MRSILKLALVSMLAMVFAGGAALAELKISSDVMVAFGHYTVESTVTNSAGATQTTAKTKSGGLPAADVQLEGNVNFDGSGDSWYGKLRMRVREDNASGFATHRSHIYWKATDQLHLGFWGRGFGLGSELVGYGVYTLGTFGAGMPIGDAVAFATSFSDTPGLDVQFNASDTMQAGLVITPGCKSGCSWGNSYTAGPNGVSNIKGQTPVTAVGVGGTTTTVAQNVTNFKMSANKDTYSFVPYFKGSFGPATVGFTYIMGKGKISGGADNGLAPGANVSDDDKDFPGSTAMTLSTAVKLDGGIAIGFDYTTKTNKCDASILFPATTALGPVPNVTGNSCDDQKDTAMALGARAAGVQFHYVTNKSEYGVTINPGGAKDSTKTELKELAAAYPLDMGGVTLSPQFAQRTTTVTQTQTAPGAQIESKREDKNLWLGVGVAAKL